VAPHERPLAAGGVVDPVQPGQRPRLGQPVLVLGDRPARAARPEQEHEARRGGGDGRAPRCERRDPRRRARRGGQRDDHGDRDEQQRRDEHDAPVPAGNRHPQAPEETSWKNSRAGSVW
jgi:hypothetical protein